MMQQPIIKLPELAAPEGHVVIGSMKTAICSFLLSYNGSLKRQLVITFVAMEVMRRIDYSPAPGETLEEAMETISTCMKTAVMQAHEQDLAQCLDAGIKPH